MLGHDFENRGCLELNFLSSAHMDGRMELYAFDWWDKEIWNYAECLLY